MILSITMIIKLKATKLAVVMMPIELLIMKITTKLTKRTNFLSNKNLLQQYQHLSAEMVKGACVEKKSTFF